MQQMQKFFDELREKYEKLDNFQLTKQNEFLLIHSSTINDILYERMLNLKKQYKCEEEEDDLAPLPFTEEDEEVPEGVDPSVEGEEK